LVGSSSSEVVDSKSMAMFPRNLGDVRFVFGTYRKSGPLLDIAIRQAIGEARGRIFLVDTATKYGNQAEIAATMRHLPGVRIGSKVSRPGRVAEDLREMESLFGASLYRVLLHRPMALSDWSVLEEAKLAGRVSEIGVCNYSFEKLQQLLAQCEIQPDVVQNELHPCIDTSVPELCQKRGIRFEAHSVMAANKHLALFGQSIQQRLGPMESITPAQVAIAYCMARGADVCFSTGNLQHLRQDLLPSLATLFLPNEIQSLSRLALTHPIRLYRTQGSPASDEELLFARLKKDVDDFKAGRAFSRLCLEVPKTHRGTAGEIAKHMAHKLLPEEPEVSRFQKFDGLLHRMRKGIESLDEAARAARRAQAPRVCAFPRTAVAFPDALPVDIPEPSGFQGFLQELRASNAMAPVTYPRRFEKGALFPDGRMDLCKQVIQPCFEELCDAVAASGTVRHFLLGNNVVFRDGSAQEIASRLEALEKFLKSDPHVETWYLAGNGINAELSVPIAAAFKHASHLRALWLKMNPVKTGARQFAELVASHSSLELLDLFNTGLCDSGVRAFRDGLAVNGGSKVLKHLYLSVNDIADGEAVAEIVRLLPNLESLFLGVNLLGDAGLAHVLQALRGHPSLERLECGSNDLTDASLPLLLEVVESAPRLQSLVLGSYKSTDYFGGRHNKLTDAELLVRIACYVGYLNLDGGIEGVDLSALEAGVTSRVPKTEVFARQGPASNRQTLLVEHGAGRRQLQHPHPFVDQIESIYRNQM